LLRLLLLEDSGRKVTGHLDAVALEDRSILLHLELQGLNLLPERLDQHRVGVSVDNWLVLDVPGPACVPNGAQGFFVVCLGRRHASNHCGTRVTTQRVLQDSRQLRISVWNMPLVSLVLRQGTDYLAQAKQALVDADSFLQQLARSTSLLDSLRAGQVDEVELGGYLLSHCGLLSIWVSRRIFGSRRRSLLTSFSFIDYYLCDNFLFNRDGKDRMRS